MRRARSERMAGSCPAWSLNNSRSAQDCVVPENSRSNNAPSFVETLFTYCHLGRWKLKFPQDYPTIFLQIFLNLLVTPRFTCDTQPLWHPDSLVTPRFTRDAQIHLWHPADRLMKSRSTCDTRSFDMARFPKKAKSENHISSLCKICRQFVYLPCTSIIHIV